MPVTRISLLLISLTLLFSGTPTRDASAQMPPLIPRDYFFGNPERANPKLSPDGKRLAWLAPDQKNILQVWVKSSGASDDHVITADRKRGIRTYFWSQDSRILLYLQDADGDENWHIYGVDLAAQSIRDYTPFQGVQAGALRLSRKHPREMLAVLNLRDRRFHDVYRIDLDTGALRLATKNPGDVNSWLADDALSVRGAASTLKDGRTRIRVRSAANTAWKTLLISGSDDEVDLLDFSASGRKMIVQSSVGSDTGRVIEVDLLSRKERVIASHSGVDAGVVVIHPVRHRVQAVSFPRGRVDWRVVDPDLRVDFRIASSLASGDMYLHDRDAADNQWLVSFTADQAPLRYYRYDRKKKRGSFMFSVQPKLEGLKLAQMRSFDIRTRDGLALPSYLTLPVGTQAKALPMVLHVHGGPWGRDNWGYNSTVQWLANRGYAVLQVNFRGSAGFGKRFLHAGDRQWGRKMHDDLIDSVNWAVEKGIADPAKVAIMGGSYGGYAALAGAAFTPDTFRCAIDIVGPSNLFTLLRSIPPYWETMRALFDLRVGRLSDARDEGLLRAASPLFSADRIKIPMLIGQGANDPRVKQAEAEQIVSAIAKRGGQAVYVLYPDEGHGFARPENRLDFFARAEVFLAENLGGRVEALEGDRIAGSTAIVKRIDKRIGN